MAVESKIKILIASRRTGNTYKIARFTEFHVDIDLETDADTFDFVLKNPYGVYTGLFSKFDRVKIYVNSKCVMKGHLDKVEYIMRDTDNYIMLSGRDFMWKLIDNDALPNNLENVDPKSYIEGKCSEYRLKHKIAAADTYEKLNIGCGESEISIMNNILLESKQRIWYLVDTVYTGNWETGKKPKNTFVMRTSKVGIPIESFRFAEDGTDMRSEIRVYGSNGDGGYDLQGTANNNYMQKIGVTKRRTRRAYSEKASSKYTSIADKDIRSSFRDNQELTIDVRLNQKVFMPNTTAKVINGTIGMNCTMFIRRVQYSKTLDNGTVCTLSMIPANSTFEKIWQSKGGSPVKLTKRAKGLK